MGVGVTGTGVGVTGTGVGVAGTGVGVAGTGVGVAGTGVGVAGTGVGETVGVGDGVGPAMELLAHKASAPKARTARREKRVFLRMVFLFRLESSTSLMRSYADRALL